MSKRFSTRISKSVKATAKRLAKMRDEDIDFSDIPPLTEEFFRDAKLFMPKTKAAITMRVDPEILEWFKRRGPGYQTRMNAVLKATGDHEKRGRQK